MNIGQLIQFALGATEANKVDTSIPQSVFDGMGPRNRDNIAGWYYDQDNRIFGRLLTKTECFVHISTRIAKGELRLTMLGYDVTTIASGWACRDKHIETGEIQIEEIV